MHACMQNVRGSVGVPTPGTALRVVDPDTLADVEDGQQGLLLARGPGITQGYYNDPAATSKAFRAGGGWFDTGAALPAAGQQAQGVRTLHACGRGVDRYIGSAYPVPKQQRCTSTGGVARGRRGRRGRQRCQVQRAGGSEQCTMPWHS